MRFFLYIAYLLFGLTLQMSLFKAHGVEPKMSPVKAIDSQIQHDLLSLWELDYVYRGNPQACVARALYEGLEAKSLGYETTLAFIFSNNGNIEVPGVGRWAFHLVSTVKIQGQVYVIDTLAELEPVTLESYLAKIKVMEDFGELKGEKVRVKFLPLVFDLEAMVTQLMRYEEPEHEVPSLEDYTETITQSCAMMASDLIKAGANSEVLRGLHQKSRELLMIHASDLRGLPEAKSCEALR
jgi:hypothetical protein